ncbi:UNVERIFIED_CONTAM: hypothetical protein Scaly_1034700 [Sesamum calycinum]|uniref:Uncharacterized protein n=1 Tax=Sesamum calycinum TaxID=2727403 RepID=A0AAW2QK25_9LAMI
METKLGTLAKSAKNTKFGTPDEVIIYACDYEYYDWTSHGEDIVQDYYEAPSVPQVSNEPFADDGTRSCPMDAGVVAELVDIKADSHISERIYDRISQWANRILPSDHTLSEDTYSTKKLDDVDLEYYKFYGDGRYKPARANPHRKKSPYAVLRYLPLIPHLWRLYSSRATAKHMTWYATHQTMEGSICHLSDAEAWKHFDRMYPDFCRRDV